MLDALPRRSPIILTNTRGQPWTQDGFQTSEGKARKTAGLSRLHFHDLRGTAITRLSEAGATSQEIATITGHSLRTVHEILDKFWPGVAHWRRRRFSSWRTRREQSLQTGCKLEARHRRLRPPKSLKIMARPKGFEPLTPNCSMVLYPAELRAPAANYAFGAAGREPVI